MTPQPTYEELKQQVNELQKKVAERQQLDKKLRLLSLAVEQSSEGIAVVDLDGNLEYLNDAFAKMHGYSPDELMGKHLAIFHTPEQMPSVDAANQQIKETGKFNGEIWHVTVSGKVFPTLMHNSLLKDETGNPIGMIGALRDISDIKQVEEELRKSHAEIAKRVKERTAELENINAQLKLEIEERRQAEKDLSIFRSFAEESRQGLGMADLEGNIVYSNSALCKVLGEKSPTDAIGNNIRNYYPEKLRAELENEILPIVTAEGQWTGELPLLSTKGDLTPAIQSIFLIRDDNKKPLYLANVITDITDKKRAEEALQAALDGLEQRVEERTKDLVLANEKLKKEIEERKQAEEALRESEERFRETIELLPSIVCEYDTQGRFTYVNSYGLEAFGYTLSDLEQGLFANQIFPSDEIAKFKERFNLLLRGEKQDSVEYRVQRKDGSIKYVLANSAPIYKDGKTIGARSSVTSITERKKIEEALRESEKRYRLLADNVTDVIWVRDMDLALTYVSPSIINQTGHTVEETMGRTLEQALTPDSLKLVGEVVAEELKIEEDEQKDRFRSRTIEVEINCKDGATIWTEIKMTFLRDPLGNPTGIIGVTRDITERKRLEAQLQQAHKMESLGTLAGGIAHDFNNLLMGIQGRTSLMLLDTDSYDPHFEHLKGIEGYVQSASDLTKQLLAFARGGKYEVKPVDLNAIIQKSSDMFGRTKKEIIIHRKSQKDIWAVEVDRSQIEQVMLNLYVNAWQSMPGGGELFLETENVRLDDDFLKPYGVKSGKYVKISVTDTGVGMDKATRERIFDPFFTTKEMGRGTGLGLASAYGIINNHEGIIIVESTKGMGATFHVYLPASDKQVIKETEPSTEIIKGQETILLVDDEDMILEVGKALLKQMGYKVLVAPSGQAAIELYKANQDEIEMVILDMIMPEMGGGDTYDRLKKINPDIKALLSSGYSIDGEATEILKRGCNGFIQKPFDIKDLSQKIRAVLDEQR